MINKLRNFSNYENFQILYFYYSPLLTLKKYTSFVKTGDVIYERDLVFCLIQNDQMFTELKKTLI